MLGKASYAQKFRLNNPRSLSSDATRYKAIKYQIAGLDTSMARVTLLRLFSCLLRADWTDFHHVAKADRNLVLCGDLLQVTTVQKRVPLYSKE